MILGPMAVLLQRGYADLLSDVASEHLALELIEEAVAVLQAYFPGVYTIDGVWNWIKPEANRHNPAEVSTTLLSMLQGTASDINWHNGWLVKVGAKRGIACPKHMRLIELVKEKERAIAKELQRMEEGGSGGQESRRNGGKSTVEGRIEGGGL